MVRCPTCDVDLTLGEMIIHGLKNHKVKIESKDENTHSKQMDD